MLMLERAAETVNPSECNDPAVLLACSLGSDSCPAACRADEETTVDENGNKVVVKSGDLSISATAAEGKKVLLEGGTSDLDTITLKVSEAITINSITLERYGFSSYLDIANIWLENADGVKIANEKSLSSSKDTVTLNIKKEYKTFDNDDTITIVIETNNLNTPAAYTKYGTSIGFKVVSVDSTAKNLDISNYSPYLYDMIEYAGSNVTVNVKGKDTKYHYEAGKAYEVARFQVKASNSAIKVDGFTLTNDPANTKLDLDKYLDNVVVSLSDGTELSNVRFDANKDDELKVTFDPVEVAINKSVIFVVEVSLKDLDKFNTEILFNFAKSSDVNAKESKNDVRATVTLNGGAPLALHTYSFQGGKIEVSNTKISDNVDAWAWASDVVIWKGKITVPESIKLNDFKINVSSTIDPETAIETFKMIIGNDEFEGTIDSTPWNSRDYTFSNVTIDESDNIQFVVDLKDDTNWTLKWKTLTFATFDKTVLLDTATNTKLWRYEDSRQPILAATDWAGSITLSKIRIQAAKWSLTNTSKDQEFLVNQTARKVIFDGTYTAQKQDLNLTEFAVRLDYTAAPTATPEITYYLSIDGKEVGSYEYVATNKTTAKTTAAASQWVSDDADFLTEFPESFSNILVKQGEKVSVKLEANVKATATAETYSPVLILRWEDKDGNSAGFASEFTSKIKVVAAGSVTVSESGVMPKESVELADKNTPIARFVVKSSKNTEGMDLNSFVLSYDGNLWTAASLAQANVRVKVDGEELVAGTDYKVDSAANHCYEPNTFTDTTAAGVVVNDGGTSCINAKKTWVPQNSIYVAWLSDEIPTAGLDVEVIAKDVTAGKTYTYVLSDVNGSNPGTKFSKLVLKSVASIKSQENRGDSTTKFTFAVEKDSDNESIQNLILYTKDATKGYVALNTTPVSSVEEGTTLEVINADKVQFVDAIAWWGATIAADGTVTLNGWVAITKVQFRDFFKVGDADAQVFRTK